MTFYRICLQRCHPHVTFAQIFNLEPWGGPTEWKTRVSGILDTSVPLGKDFGFRARPSVTQYEKDAGYRRNSSTWTCFIFFNHNFHKFSLSEPSGEFWIHCRFCTRLRIIKYNEFLGTLGKVTPKRIQYFLTITTIKLISKIPPMRSNYSSIVYWLRAHVQILLYLCIMCAIW